MDALVPFTEAFATAVESSGDVSQAWQTAAAASEDVDELVVVVAGKVGLPQDLLVVAIDEASPCRPGRIPMAASPLSHWPGARPAVSIWQQRHVARLVLLHDAPAVLQYALESTMHEKFQ